MKTVFALLIALLASTAAFSQDRPTIAAQPNSVFVGAEGLLPDNNHCWALLANFTVTITPDH